LDYSEYFPIARTLVIFKKQLGFFSPQLFYFFGFICAFFFLTESGNKMANCAKKLRSADVYLIMPDV